MDEKQISNVSKQLQEVLGEDKLDALGRQTRYCEKKRLLTPFRMVLALVTGLGGRPIQFLSDLHRQFNALLVILGSDQAKPLITQNNRLLNSLFWALNDPF